MHRGWIWGLAGAAAIAVVFAVAYAVGFALVTGPWAVLFVFAFPTLGILSVVTVLVWWHARRREKGKEQLPPHRAMPAPVAAPDEDALVEIDVIANSGGPVTACPECAYLGIRYPGMREGQWPGGGETGARMVCPRCHWQGIPIAFDDADEYAAFVRGLQSDARAT